MKFGEYLIQQQAISSESLQQALAVQRFRKNRIGRILRDLGLLSQNSLNRHLEGFLRPRSHETFAQLREQAAALEIPDQVGKWCAQSGLVPIGFDDSTLIVAAAQFQDEIVEHAEKLSNRIVQVKIYSPELLSAMRGHLGGSSEPKPKLTLVTRLTDDQKLESEDPYVVLYRECVTTATQLGVSDIHIEPKAKALIIRFRLHGELSNWKVLSEEHKDVFLTKVKWLTNLDLSISGRSQDSRATYYSLKLNLRVNALPSRHGDKIVLRLLDQSKEFNLEKSMLSQNVLSDLKNAAAETNGLIVLSGPTGSGKTTTLYGLINSLDHNTKNISTLEDPSEYELEGITQTEISNQLSFANALRALMRQDPDIIFLGEIRDEETAKLAFKIANTGHLVITTLHSNGALQSIERLRTLGVDDFSIQSSLRFTGAQRLLQELCPDCSMAASDVDVSDSRELLKPFEKTLSAAPIYRVAHPAGCSKCKHGIAGRVPIMEYATASDIANYIKGAAPSKCLRQTLRQATLDWVAQGRVNLRDLKKTGG